MNIRIALEADLQTIEEICLAAFEKVENVLIANIAQQITSEASSSQSYPLVAEQHGAVVGFIAFTPLTIESGITGSLLAPLAVHPEHQRSGIGTSLIKTGTDILTKHGVDFLFTYGDPDYYGRFGFNTTDAAKFIPPYPLEYDFGWIGMKLRQTHAPTEPVRFGCVPALMNEALW
jgi:putative acetyltransferase